MILVFGGVHQGKLDYVQKRFGIEEAHHCNDTTMPISKVICGFDQWILALVRANAEIPLQEFIDANPNSIVICNDVSGGIVPIEEDLRKWREEVGRAMAKLAQHSDEVIRLFCGIPTHLKQEKHSFKYFCNRDCKYFPCHTIDSESFNCLFCFCPLYRFDDCGGNFEYSKKGIKMCMDCTMPHIPENYDVIMDKLKSV